MPRRLKPTLKPHITRSRKAWLREANKGAPFDVNIAGASSLAELELRTRQSMAGAGTFTLMRSRFRQRDGEIKTVLQLASETFPGSFSPKQVSGAAWSNEEAAQIARGLKRGFWVDFILGKSKELYHRSW
ncbi:MAG: hypothetical protein HY544_01480 [Candidatus Diapherotrites archaeon]|uniref:Uncharacterized protein n=1 Tax=Candidatus Iainarchaeum sp. TaxID=3101447 RepID=A0A8T3YIS9_9ARCH|nr:hypothetical protein [Candidatus Diapherotrites archaeon]